MLKEKIFQWVDPFLRLKIFGLDISCRSAKFVAFREDSKGRPLSFGEVEIPEGIIIKGEIQDQDTLVRILKEWIQDEKRRIGTAYAVVSLPEERSFLRLIQIPKVGREEVAQAIRWEIEAHVPLPLDEIMYDYEVVEPLADTLDHLDVMVIAFPRKIIASYLSVMKSAGIQPVAFELGSQAMARAILKDQKNALSTIIGDIGRTKTSFAIASAGALIFTKTIELGGETIEANIKKAMAVDAKEARKLKIELGLNKRAYEGKLFTAIIPAVAALTDEAVGAIEYFRQHASHTHGASPEVREMNLAGGDANLAGLDTYLASALKIPVRRATPFEIFKHRLTSPLPPMPKNVFLVYATALGLAMWNNHEGY